MTCMETRLITNGITLSLDNSLTYIDKNDNLNCFQGVKLNFHWLLDPLSFESFKMRHGVQFSASNLVVDKSIVSFYIYHFSSVMDFSLLIGHRYSRYQQGRYSEDAEGPRFEYPANRASISSLSSLFDVVFLSVGFAGKYYLCLGLVIFLLSMHEIFMTTQQYFNQSI